MTLKVDFLSSIMKKKKIFSIENSSRLLSKGHILQTLLHMIQITVSFIYFFRKFFF